MSELRFFGFCILAGFALVLAGGCGKKEEPPRNSISGLFVDPEISSQIREHLHADLEFIKKTDLTQADPRFAKLMGIPSATGAEIHKKFAEGVHFIVRADYDANQHLVQYNGEYEYPNKGAYPKIDGHSNIVANNATNSDLISANHLSSSIYLAGKKVSKLLGVDVANMRLWITSPYIGLMQLGPAFQRKDLSGNAARIYESATLIHEWDHGRGNGTNLGKFHSICPRTNLHACDPRTNGPYFLEALYMKSAINSVTHTPAEKATLETVAYEYFGRVQMKTGQYMSHSKTDLESHEVNDTDSTPEGHV